MINVRLCACVTRGTISSISYSNRITTTELGQRENLRLNLASQFKEDISLNQKRRVDLQVVLSMVKAILLEVYTSGTPHHGLYLVWDRIYKVLVDTYLLSSNRVTVTQVIKYYLKMWKGLPKESVIEVCAGTGGSPKEVNFHGDRILIVPQIRNFMLSGRSIGQHVFNRNLVGFGETKRHLSTNKGIQMELPVESELTIMNKLKSLYLWSLEHKNSVIDRKLYVFLFNEDLFLVAYNKLKSNPGNMTPGINPTTLDGLSKDWISKTIESLRNESFQFSAQRRKKSRNT